MKQLSKPLAMAAGIAALVVATSTGTAVASSLITSNDIQDGTIRSVDIKDTGVHHRDLGLHLQSKIAKHATNGVDGAKGTQGPEGPRGPQGEPGQDADISSYVRHVQVQIPAGEKAEGTATCDEGDLAVGGGYSSNDQTNGWAKIYQNRMTWVNTGNEATPDGWYAQALGGDRDADMYVWAVCLAS